MAAEGLRDSLRRGHSETHGGKSLLSERSVEPSHPCEARMAVLDEVTRAFAPWIQRLRSGSVKILILMLL